MYFYDGQSIVSSSLAATQGGYTTFYDAAGHLTRGTKLTTGQGGTTATRGWSSRQQRCGDGWPKQYRDIQLRCCGCAAFVQHHDCYHQLDALGVATGALHHHGIGDQHQFI